ncbi:zinc finger protein 708 [Aplysia californica]|uniref:Zinc finger protein 708 n=1 Tax=Aplysia californica TaxID=6500 RepID=A0ABM1VQX4_APLCA|nr:zinc finger protein 708 [Aplysia californica]XP_035824817.1 zinc finger protein 708 [Aplysia californica]
MENVSSIVCEEDITGHDLHSNRPEDVPVSESKCSEIKVKEEPRSDCSGDENCSCDHEVKTEPLEEGMTENSFGVALNVEGVVKPRNVSEREWQDFSKIGKTEEQMRDDEEVNAAPELSGNSSRLAEKFPLLSSFMKSLQLMNGGSELLNAASRNNLSYDAPTNPADEDLSNEEETGSPTENLTVFFSERDADSSSDKIYPVRDMTPHIGESHGLGFSPSRSNNSPLWCEPSTSTASFFKEEKGENMGQEQNKKDEGHARLDTTLRLKQLLLKRAGSKTSLDNVFSDGKSNLVSHEEQCALEKTGGKLVKPGRDGSQLIEKLGLNHLQTVKKKRGKVHKCDVCDAVFSQKKDLKYHSFKHTGEKPYRCDVCDARFRRANALTRHTLIHTGEKPYRCDLCDVRFRHNNVLKRHILTHTGEKPYQCDLCDARFTQKSKLKCHILKHKGEKPFTCDVCNKDFYCNSKLKRHALVHSNKKPFKIFTCDAEMKADAVEKQGLLQTKKKAYKSDTNLKTNILKQYSLIPTENEPIKSDVNFKAISNIFLPAALKQIEEKPFKCGLCDAKFSLRSSLKQHGLVHMGERPFKCDVCDARFKRMNTLTRHKLTHTGERPYKCDICGSRFSRISTFRTHVFIHTEEKPYKCDVCGAGFTSRYDLKVHTSRHTGETPYKCNVCRRKYYGKARFKKHACVRTVDKPRKCAVCGSVFTNNATLRQHTLIHIGDKPHRCDVCGKSFRQQSTLRQHTLIHTGEKPHKCVVCDARFRKRHTLKRHFLMHTGEKPYRCDLCGASFSRLDHTKLHISKHLA